MGYPLTMMKVSYFQAPCSSTTGWLVVTDTNLAYAPCPDYIQTEPQPFFKYSAVSTAADLTTGYMFVQLNSRKKVHVPSIH